MKKLIRGIVRAVAGILLGIVVLKLFLGNRKNGSVQIDPRKIYKHFE